MHRARTTKRDGEGLLNALSKPLTLRKQGICGEVESGVIEHFLLLHWPKRSGSPKRGRMERRFDLTPATRRQRTTLFWLEASYNPASDNRQTITESCRALSCIYNPCISVSVYQCISLSIKGYIMELHVVAVFEIYCALEPKKLGSADDAGRRWKNFHGPSTKLLGAF